jgi:hypothetical protein
MIRIASLALLLCAGIPALAEPGPAAVILVQTAPAAWGRIQLQGFAPKVEATAAGVVFQGGKAVTVPWKQVAVVRTAAADFLPPAAAGAPREEPATPGEVRLIGPITARLTLSDGTSSDGMLLSLTAREVGFQSVNSGLKVKEPYTYLGATYPAERIWSLAAGGKYYIYRPTLRIIIETKDPPKPPPPPTDKEKDGTKTDPTKDGTRPDPPKSTDKGKTSPPPVDPQDTKD